MARPRGGSCWLAPSRSMRRSRFGTRRRPGAARPYAARRRSPCARRRSPCARRRSPCARCSRSCATGCRLARPPGPSPSAMPSRRGGRSDADRMELGWRSAMPSRRGGSKARGRPRHPPGPALGTAASARVRALGTALEATARRRRRRCPCSSNGARAAAPSRAHRIWSSRLGRRSRCQRRRRGCRTPQPSGPDLPRCCSRNASGRHRRRRSGLRVAGRWPATAARGVARRECRGGGARRTSLRNARGRGVSFDPSVTVVGSLRTPGFVLGLRSASGHESE